MSPPPGCFSCVRVCSWNYTGGDLKFHLNFEWPEKKVGSINDRKKRHGGFDEDRVKFYLACTVLALDYMHSQRILHRDVKPENIVLHESGYARLTDLGISALCEDGDDMICTLASGTRPYMAPEQLGKAHRHGIPADYWQLGITMYEITTGKRPFKSAPQNLVRAIPQDGSEADIGGDVGAFSVSANCDEASEAARDFLDRILSPGHWNRLGRNRESVASELKSHRFFAGLEWEAVETQTVPAPFIPNISVANCDTGNNDMRDAFGVDEAQYPPDADQARFSGYEFNCDLAVRPLLGAAVGFPTSPVG